MFFVYFINDLEMDGPTTPGEWHGATHLMEELLGIDRRHNLSEFVVDAFVDVTAIREGISQGKNSRIATKDDRCSPA